MNAFCSKRGAGSINPSFLILAPCEKAFATVALVLGVLASVQDIMLRHENQVVHHGHIPQCKLDGISRYTRPVALQVAIGSLLGDAKNAAGKVKQNLPDAPAYGGAVAVVDHDLWSILDESDNKLHIRHGVYSIKPDPSTSRAIGAVPLWGAQHDEEHYHDAGDAAEEDAEDEAARPVPDARSETPHAWKKILAGRYQRQDQTVSSEGDVVESNGGREALVARGILRSNEWRVEEGGVVDEIAEETCFPRRRVRASASTRYCTLR